MNKFCTNCGSPIDANSKACLNCGVLTGNNNKKKGLPTWAIILIVLVSVMIIPILFIIIGYVMYANMTSTTLPSIEEIDKEYVIKDITIETINDEKIPFNIDEVSLNISETSILGDVEKLERVSIVKAKIDLERLNNPKDGDNIIQNIYLDAYDKDGNMLDVEILQEKVTATITLSSSSITIPIKVVPKGEIEYGKAISSITTSINTITIYGAEETINEYNNSYIPIEINVDGLSEDKTFTVDIDKPTGINKISQKKITVEVKLGEENRKEIENIMIEAKGLGANLKVSAIGPSQTSISVIVIGVSEVLEGISQENIKAFVDLKGLGVGEHIVSIEITGDNNLVTYMPKTTAIKVRISES